MFYSQRNTLKAEQNLFIVHLLLRSCHPVCSPQIAQHTTLMPSVVWGRATPTDTDKHVQGSSYRKLLFLRGFLLEN